MLASLYFVMPSWDASLIFCADLFPARIPIRPDREWSGGAILLDRLEGVCFLKSPMSIKNISSQKIHSVDISGKGYIEFLPGAGGKGEIA